MSEIKLENGVLVIDAKAEVFVVPNMASPVTEYFDKVEREKQMAEISVINRCEYERSDLLVELWWSSAELSSENIGDHGCTVPLSNNKRGLVFGPGKMPVSRLPINICKKIKEGEECEIILPVDLDTHSQLKLMDEFSAFDAFHIPKRVYFRFKVTGAQGKYRYRRYGTFEHAMEGVINSYNSYHANGGIL